MARTSKATDTAKSTKKSAVRSSASNSKTEAGRDCSTGKRCSKSSTTRSCS